MIALLGLCLAWNPAAATERPPMALQLAVTPDIGWMAESDRAVQGLSLGAIGARASSLEGAGMAWLFHRVDGEMAGLQSASLLSSAGGPVQGLQAASLVARSEAAVEGVQASGAVALVGDGVEGVQAAGAVALSRGRVEGAQLAGGVAVARSIRGAQIAPLNIAERVDGLQLGVVNLAREVDGVSIGLLSLVGNGYNHVHLSSGTHGVAQGLISLGTPALHSVAGAGWIEVGESWWTAGGGLGSHLDLGPAWLDVDGTAWAVVEGLRAVRAARLQLRARAGLGLWPHLSPWVGLSGSALLSGGAVRPQLVGFPPALRTPERGPRLWPGLELGLRI